MQTIHRPDRKDWPALVARPAMEVGALDRSVRRIMESVRRKGDRAVRSHTKAFDGVRLRSLEVQPKDLRAAERLLDPGLRDAIRQAAANIRRFHEPQRHAEEPVETMPGVRCWRRPLPIDTVGLYIPGGSAPLFSTVLMLAVPASIAGCREVVLCTPPDATGGLHPAIRYAAALTGVHRVFRVGGVQAVAAMAYGTGSIPRVDKIFGPGNQYVTAAKRIAQSEGVAIDMPAGPSEVCILADGGADPDFVAADLLSQAEHGPDSQVLLISDDDGLIARTIEALGRQVRLLGRQGIAEQALANSRAVRVADLAEGMDLANAYAPEHLIIACRDAEAWADRVRSAGSVFLGDHTPESAGDYASGTNHTLPTHGHARAYSGVSVDSFVRKTTFQRITPEGLRHIGSTVIRMAEAEGLQAHAEAVRLRLRSLDAVSRPAAPPEVPTR
jgi:histidinol dehydrogenase